jgi:hypothetical protein
MKHLWKYTAGRFEIERHVCKKCGAVRLRTRSSADYPLTVYKLPDGTEVRGRTPPCEPVAVT